ncbi:MAG: RNA methyltransferase [Candidatus Omnitrophota bacterium]
MMFLYGKNSSFERLKANPGSIKKIFLEENFAAPHIEELIKLTRIPVQRVSRKMLRRIKPLDSLQGIVAEVENYKYADFDDLLNQPQQLSFIFLDRVFDPQNLGAIIRTTACFGGLAVVIPKHKACAVTEAVVHVAAGGENFTPVAMVSNLTKAILAAKKCGLWVLGAVVEAGEDINNFALPFPLCFVLGSEASGIRYGIRKHLDKEVHIPMKGAPLSFNVATTCAILCQQISRQRENQAR